MAALPKEAWYGDRIARHVDGRTYYVWRGEWSDPVYVLAKKILNVPVFGVHIEGTEVGYADVWDGYGEDDHPAPADIAADVEELAYLAIADGL